MEWKVTSNPPELSSITMEALVSRGLTWEEFLDETLDQLQPLSEETLARLQINTPYDGSVSALIGLLTVSHGGTLEQEPRKTPEKEPNFFGFCWNKLRSYLPRSPQKPAAPEIALHAEFLATGDTRNPTPTLLLGDEFGVWDIPLSWVLLYCETTHSLTLCLGKTSFDTPVLQNQNETEMPSVL